MPASSSNLTDRVRFANNTTFSSSHHHHHHHHHQGTGGGSECDDEDEDETYLTQFRILVTGLLALVCIAGTLTILVLLYVTVRPCFGHDVYRRLAGAWGLQVLLDAMVLLLPTTRVLLTSDSDVPTPATSGLFLANHVSNGDWWGVLLLARAMGLRRGSLRVFLRNEYLKLGQKHRNGTAASPDIAIMAKLLHLFLDFPLYNGDADTQEREALLTLLRSLSTQRHHHLLLYPEGWSSYNGSDRRTVHQKSNSFASSEGKPILQHLLLPRTRGLYGSLECLRTSNNSIDKDFAVYDVTMVYTGYAGELPAYRRLNLWSLWKLLHHQSHRRDLHVRIKKSSLEDVLQDTNWIFKKWAEKDRLLENFARTGQLESNRRRYRILDGHGEDLETSVIGLIRLLVMPWCVPLLVLLSVPLWWILGVGVLLVKLFGPPTPEEPSTTMTNGHRTTSNSIISANGPNTRSASSTPMHQPGTPFVPATPFVSPSPFAWRDMFSPKNNR